MSSGLRSYSSADDLTDGDLKNIKERLDTVGIEPSRLLAEWMEKSLGLELVIPDQEGDTGTSENAEERKQAERQRIIGDIVKRVRSELGPINGVDSMYAREEWCKH